MDDDDCGAIGGMDDWQGKPKYSEKPCPSATLSTTNVMCPGHSSRGFPSKLQAVPDAPSPPSGRCGRVPAVADAPAAAGLLAVTSFVRAVAGSPTCLQRHFPQIGGDLRCSFHDHRPHESSEGPYATVVFRPSRYIIALLWAGVPCFLRYKCCHLLRYTAVQSVCEPTFRWKLYIQSSGSKIGRARNQRAAR
jgi:hypothetical protein